MLSAMTGGCSGSKCSSIPIIANGNGGTVRRIMKSETGSLDCSKLADFDPVTWGATDVDETSRIPDFRFDERAQEVFIEWARDLQTTRIPTRAMRGPAHHRATPGQVREAPSRDRLDSALGRMRCYRHRGQVSEDAALRAAAWCEYLNPTRGVAMGCWPMKDCDRRKRCPTAYAAASSVTDSPLAKSAAIAGATCPPTRLCGQRWSGWRMNIGSVRLRWRRRTGIRAADIPLSHQPENPGNGRSACCQC